MEAAVSALRFLWSAGPLQMIFFCSSINSLLGAGCLACVFGFCCLFLFCLQKPWCLLIVFSISSHLGWEGKKKKTVFLSLSPPLPSSPPPPPFFPSQELRRQFLLWSLMGDDSLERKPDCLLVVLTHCFIPASINDRCCQG